MLRLQALGFLVRLLQCFKRPRSAHEDIFVTTDPGRVLREGADHTPIQASWGAIVDVFRTRLGAKLRIPQPPCRCLVFPPVPLVTDAEAHTFSQPYLPRSS